MNREHQDVTHKLIKITGMSLLFMTIELVGGYLADSIAIFADAFHLLSDVLAYLISLGAVWLSTRPNPPKYLTFGWEKAQPLGALINVAIIYVVTVELFIQATSRMVGKQVVDKPLIMLLTSIFGLICNLIIMQILHNDPHGGHHGCSHGHSHSHSHDHEHFYDRHHNHNHTTQEEILQCEQKSGRNFEISSEVEHSHQCTGHSHHAKTQLKKAGRAKQDHVYSDIINQNVATIGSIDNNALSSSLGSDQEIKQSQREKRIKNINIEAAYIHIITDIILSIGVIISALIIYFFAGDTQEWSLWQLADPLCTYFFSFLAIYSTWPIVKESVTLLLDGAHEQDLVEDIQKELRSIPEVKELVELKLWSTNREKNYGAVRVRMEKGYSGWRVKRTLALRGVQGFVDVVDEDAPLSEEN